MDASGFVSVSEAVPDILLDVRYYSTYNFIGRRVDGYEQPVALLCRQAADALIPAADRAAKLGLRLKVWDAYRPQRAVDSFVRLNMPDDNASVILFTLDSANLSNYTSDEIRQLYRHN